MGGRNNGNRYNQAKNFSNDDGMPKIEKAATQNDNRNNWPQNINNGSINIKNNFKKR